MTAKIKKQSKAQLIGIGLVLFVSLPHQESELFRTDKIFLDCIYWFEICRVIYDHFPVTLAREKGAFVTSSPKEAKSEKVK